MNQIKVVVGKELFRFGSFAQWVNKARGWFQGHRKYICIDEAGRVCQTGAEFGRADRERRFPVVVYSVVLPEAAPQNVEETKPEHPPAEQVQN